MEPALQVKQAIGIVVNARGVAFHVFHTGDSSRYLFCQLYAGTTIQTGLQLPIYKNDLVAPVRSALASGCGIDMRSYKPPKEEKPKRERKPSKPRAKRSASARTRSSFDVGGSGDASF